MKISDTQLVSGHAENCLFPAAAQSMGASLETIVICRHTNVFRLFTYELK